MAEKRTRSCVVVNPADIIKIKDLLVNQNLQTTPLQLGSIKKAFEGLSSIADSILEWLKVKYRFNFISDEAFGLVSYIGKKQQLHIKGYREGRLESEIEPLMHHYEHLYKPPNYQLFHGYWYSANESLGFLLDNWGIPYSNQLGDSGTRYHSEQWKYFSDPKDFYKELKGYFSSKTKNDKIVSEAIIRSIRGEINRIKKADLACLVKKSLLKSGFQSFRSCF